MDACFPLSRHCHSMWHLELEQSYWDNKDKSPWRNRNRSGERIHALGDDIWLLNYCPWGTPTANFLSYKTQTLPYFLVALLLLTAQNDCTDGCGVLFALCPVSIIRVRNVFHIGPQNKYFGLWESYGLSRIYSPLRPETTHKQMGMTVCQ